MTNYKEVIEKYRDADLYSLTEEEYRELKAAEMADMQYYVDGITASTVPEVMYRIGRPITDLKMMMESGVEAFGDKVLYHQIMPGDDHFTEFTYGGVRDDVRGLGTALLELGLLAAAENKPDAVYRPLGDVVHKMHGYLAIAKATILRKDVRRKSLEANRLLPACLHRTQAQSS